MIVLPDIDVSGDEGDPEWTAENPMPATGRGTYRWLRAPGAYAEGRAMIISEWESTVAAYEADPADFYRAWHYLDGHPAFWQFSQKGASRLPANHEVRLSHTWGIGRCVDVGVTMVNPETGRIEEDGSLNTAAAVWLEAGKAELLDDDHVRWHDPDLDCGGPTYELAILSLARLVAACYGHDRRICDGPAPARED